jgi:hypothetical protein
MNDTQKIIRILGIALAVQTLLAVAMWTTGGRAPGQQSRALLGVEEKAITAVEIGARPGPDGKVGERVKLTRSGEGWVVSSADDFPAKTDKVDEIVKKLAAMKVKSPLATQAANHNALRVGDTTWAKEVIVSAGGEPKKLIVGSGSGSSVHLRFDGQNDVFQGRGLSEFQLSNNARNYIETELVKTDADRLNAVTVTNARGTLTFRKEGTTWLLEQTPAGATLDETKVTSFISAVTRLNLDRPVGKASKPEYGLDAGATRVEILSTEEDKPVTVSYVVGGQAGAADADGFYVKASTNEWVVVATKWATESARTKGVDDFLKAPEQADKTGGEGALPPPSPEFE